MSDADLVTVVIPAYNAAVTIDETLQSVRSQTHTRLEILVVDDGSRDATPNIVLGHAAADSRIRLICQGNGGVAAARNRGIAEARAELIANVDADDLWRFDKIEKQFQALHEGGRQVALVYSWSSLIDENSRIIDQSFRPVESGNVVRALCIRNLVGNGSSALIRKAAILEAGGYDPGLRARGAQGCEDLQLYFRIAERHMFAVVPEHLTGYRQTKATMSSDVIQMFRSWEIVAAEMRSRHPELRAEVESGRGLALEWLFTRALKGRRVGGALHLAIRLARHNPRGAIETVLIGTIRQIVNFVGRRLPNSARLLVGKDVVPSRTQFLVGSPPNKT